MNQRLINLGQWRGAWGIAGNALFTWEKISGHKLVSLTTGGPLGVASCAPEAAQKQGEREIRPTPFCSQDKINLEFEISKV